MTRLAVFLMTLATAAACRGGKNAERPLVDTAPALDVTAGVDTSSDTSPGTASPSAGCTGPAGMYRAGTQAGSVTSGAVQRSFQLHLPVGYAAGRPHALVLLFHGGLGTGMQMESSSRMSPIADREGFVVVYPDGVSRSWNAGTCCGPPAEQGLDDVRFVADLLDHLESQLCIDRRRVFAGGMSNGAMFSHRLACELSTRIAAIAPVAGVNVTTACNPSRPVPLLMIHGSADKHVPWEGGMGCGIAGVPFTSVPDTIAGWQQRNRCPAAAPSLVVQQGDGRCERQGGCSPDADVVLCTIAGGGHAWPGGVPGGVDLPACVRAGDGPQSQTFIASEQMWTFFRARPLP